MKKIIATLMSLSSLLVVNSAQAEDPFQVHLEFGAATLVGKPLQDIFSPGPALEIKPLWSINNIVSIGPTVSGMYFPRTVNLGKQDSTLWQFGVASRFQFNRQQDDWKLPKISPWFEIGTAFAANGNDAMGPALNLALGAEAPLDHHKIFWLGPFVKYSHMFTTSQYPDLNVLQVGFSISFDLPVKVPTETIIKPVVKIKKIIVEKVVIKETAVKVASISFTEKVYFKTNSAALHWESRDKLDEVVKKLKVDPSTTIKVKGNASSDGPVAFNNKLSQDRTNAVVEYLVGRGIDPKRLMAESEGVTHPAASNKTLEGRERNRRVEFEVTFVTTSTK